jgi:cell division protein FtsX
VLASAFSMTAALIGLFGVLLPGIAMGLIGFAVAQSLGERAENQRKPNRWRRRSPGEDR